MMPGRVPGAMATARPRRRLGLLLAGLIAVSGGAVVWGRFSADLAAARLRVATGSTLIDTPCGPIEYQEAGAGLPLLAVHGSGGGFDQGMALAAPLAGRGIRVIAMSRFGYLRTPMPADASAGAQADALVCLMDALGIGRAAVLGGSAGALPALQLAIRHPGRVAALVLLVPLGYRPPGQANPVAPLKPWVEALMLRVLGSDFLFWAARHIAPGTLTETVLATPAKLLETASPAERARVTALLDSILPVSARAAGLRADTAAGKTLGPADLDAVRAPTLIISARDDGYGTYATAEYMAAQIAGARFIGFDTGGHVWVGHDDAVMAAIAALVTAPRGGAFP